MPDFIVDPPSDSCPDDEQQAGASLTSAVTYDGSILDCLGVSTGMDMNAVMLAMEAVCQNNRGQFVNFNTRIENLETTVNALGSQTIYTSDVVDAATYTCISTSGTLLDTLAQIDAAICALNGFTGTPRLAQTDFDKYIANTGKAFIYKNELADGDIIGSAANSATIDSIDGFATTDGVTSSVTGANVVTVSSRDNYIFADSTTQSFVVKDVPIGNPAPAALDSEIVLHKLTLDGVGAITASLDLRQYNAIDESHFRLDTDVSAFIPEDSITGFHIDLTSALAYDSVLAITNPADIVHKDYVDTAVSTVTPLWTAAGVDVYFNTGNVGIGVVADGAANLHVGGSLRYTDGNEDFGYVLTSDVNGYASWAALSLTFDGQDEGSSLNSFNAINFIGAGVTAVDGGSGVLDVTISGAIADFTDLSDTPSTYAGSADFFLRVNSGTNAVDFVDGSTINISEFNNDAGFITSYTEVDTFEDVLSRGNTTGAYNVSIDSGQSLIYNNSGFTASILESTLSGNINLSLPSVSGTFALQSELGAYLPLAGGTMTGDVTMTGADMLFTSVNKIQFQAAGGWVSFNPTDTSGIYYNAGGASTFIYAPTDEQIQLFVGGAQGGVYVNANYLELKEINTATRDAITSAHSKIVYNQTTTSLDYNDGVAWRTIANLNDIPTVLNDLTDVTITTAAQGDVLFRNATGWVNLGAGTNGQVLTSGGAAADVSWTTLAGGDGNGIYDGSGSLSGNTTVTQGAFGLTLNQTTGGVITPVLDIQGAVDSKYGININTDSSSATTANGAGLQVRSQFNASTTAGFGIDTRTTIAGGNTTSTALFAQAGNAVSNSYAGEFEVLVGSTSTQNMGLRVKNLNTSGTFNFGLYAQSTATGTAITVPSGGGRVAIGLNFASEALHVNGNTQTDGGKFTSDGAPLSHISADVHTFRGTTTTQRGLAWFGSTTGTTSLSVATDGAIGIGKDANSLVNIYAKLSGVTSNFFQVHDSTDTTMLARAVTDNESGSGELKWGIGNASATGLNSGTTNWQASAMLNIDGSAAAYGSLRIRAGVAPTGNALSDGVIWHEADALYFRSNGTTYNLTDIGGGADGNGIYDGSGSLSGVTTVTMGVFDLTFAGQFNPNFLVLDASLSRVGIGTATPSARLEVDGNVLVSGGGRLQVDNAGVPLSAVGIYAGQASFGHNNYVATGDTAIRQSVGGQVIVSGGGGAVAGVQIDFRPSSGTSLAIHDDGDIGIGIGVSSPTAKLEVGGNTNISGNVGIGTTTPTEKLDVVGNILTSGNVTSTIAASEAIQIKEDSWLTLDGTTGNGGLWYNSGLGKVTLYSDGVGKDIALSLGNSTGQINFEISAGVKGYFNDNGLVVSDDLTVDTNTLFVQSSSNRVGIGTSTPTEKLEVVGSIKMVDGNEALGKVFVSDANGVGSWGVGGGIYSGSGSLSGATTVSQNASSLTFSTSGNANQLSIINNGLGIGTPGVTGRSISQLGQAWFQQSLVSTTATGTHHQFFATPNAGMNDGGTPSTLTAFGQNAMAINEGGGIGLGGKYNNAGDYTTFAGVHGLKETAATGNFLGSLTLSTRIGSGKLDEKVRILSNGNVGIGTATPTEKLDVVGSGQFSSKLAISTTVPVASNFLQIGGTGNAGIALIGSYSNSAINITNSGAGKAIRVNNAAGGIEMTASGNPLRVTDVTSTSFIGRLTVGQDVTVANPNKFVVSNGDSVFSGSNVNVSNADLDVTGTGFYLHSSTQVVGARQTGWAAPTGTTDKTTFATGSVTLSELAERVKGLIEDLTTHGLIGA